MSTKRLYFMPVRLSDLQWNANQTDDPNIKQSYLSIMEKGFSDDGNELWYTLWEIRRKSDDKLVGVFRFFGPPSESFETALDFNIRNEFSGAGYGSEAFERIINFLFSFKKCSYIKCCINRNDKSAVNFVKKFGFRKLLGKSEEEIYELEKKRRHTALPLMLTGIAVTTALKLYFGRFYPEMWLIAPLMFTCGIIIDFFDARRRKDC